VRSKRTNQSGAGIINTIDIPPKRKNTPTEIDNTIWRLAVYLATINAPTKVPNECARNGNIKYSNSHIVESIRLTPSGIGINKFPAIINPIFAHIPSMHPIKKTNIFLKIGITSKSTPHPTNKKPHEWGLMLIELFYFSRIIFLVCFNSPASIL